MSKCMKPCVTGLRRLAAASALAIAIFIAQAPSAQALLLGAGQTATIDFDFGTAGGAPQPLTFIFEITTATPTSLSDPAGVFFHQWLDIGTGDVPFFFAYDGTGGFNPSPIANEFITTDLSGSLRLGALTESFELTGVFLSIFDGEGTPLVSSTSLTLPENADVVLPEPGPLTALGLGLIGLAVFRRRRCT